MYLCAVFKMKIYNEHYFFLSIILFLCVSYSFDKIANTHIYTLTCACMAKQHISLMKRKFAKTFRYEFFLLIAFLCALSLSLSRVTQHFDSRNVIENILFIHTCGNKVVKEALLHIFEYFNNLELFLNICL